MIVNERIVQGLSCGEFFLKFCSFPTFLRDEASLSDTLPLLDERRQFVSGKHIVCLYCGEWVGHVLAENTAVIVKDILSFLRDNFRHLHGIVLWWVDDGTVLRVFSEYENALAEGHLPNWHWPWESPMLRDLQLTEHKTQEEIIRIAEVKAAYLQIIDEMRQDASMIYDDSGDWRYVLAWADAYYGDESFLREAFQEAGKLSCRLDVTRLSDTHPEPYFEEWLSAIAHSWSEEQNAFLESSRQAKRRILLCHLTYEALLGKGIAALNDLTEVFHTARKRQDISVWWLENKNLEMILSCMEPSCAEQYDCMKKEFQTGDFCMFDDRSGLEAAITECDAYYGTPAVIVSEKAKQGMPVVWQDCGQSFLPTTSSDKLDDGLALQFIRGCWIEDEYYFPGWRQNGLFKIKRGSEEAEYVQHIPTTGKGWRNLFVATFSYESWIYFIPTNYHAVMAWNRDTDTWQSYELDVNYAWHEYVWFTDAFRVGDNIWLKPCNYGAIVRFNLPSKEISYYTGWEKEIKAAGPDENGLYIGAAVLAGNNMWMAARGSGHLVCFSLDDGASKVYDVSKAETGIASLAFDGSDLWIYAKTGDLLRWNPEQGMTLRLSEILPGCQKLGSLAFHSGKVWAFAHSQDTYACYDLNDRQVTHQEHYLPEKIRHGLGLAQLSCGEDYIYITPNFGELTVRFDPRTGTAKTWNIKLSQKDETRFARESFGCCHEPMGASAFYDMYETALFLEKSRSNTREVHPEDSVGQRIYGAIFA